MTTPATLRPVCTCVSEETLCPACQAHRAKGKAGQFPVPVTDVSLAKQRYYQRTRDQRLAYQRQYAERKRQQSMVRVVKELATVAVPDTLIAAALSGIPERWREPETFVPGPYLWHCATWQRIATTPHVCPYCGRRFFEEPTDD